MDSERPCKKRRAAASASASAATAADSNTGSSSTAVNSPFADELQKARQMMELVPRASLESLLLWGLMGGSPACLEDLRVAMPAKDASKLDDEDANTSTARKRKQQFQSPAAVASAVQAPRLVLAPQQAQQRVGTGSFDSIDQDTMLLVLSFLNLRERVLCMSSVCRSWKDFKSVTIMSDALLMDLSDDSFSKVNHTDEATRGGSRVITNTKKKTLLPSASTMKSLLEWVPSMAKVNALRISSTKQCNPKQCKEIIKMVEQAKNMQQNNKDDDTKKQREESTKNQISKLVLAGPKIYASVLQACIKATWGSQLKCLKLEDISVTEGTKIARGCVREFLKTCPLLEELYIPQKLAVRETLNNGIIDALKMARRGGGPPSTTFTTTLLRVLDLSNGYHETGTGLVWHSLQILGGSCPVLEVLKIQRLLGSQFDSYHALGQPMVPLPRLKTFSLRYLHEEESSSPTSSHSAASATTGPTTMARMLDWMFRGMPVIQDFTLGHGQPNHLKSSCLQPRLPSLGPRPAWPATLQRLTLHEFDLALDSVDSTPPSLKEIYLHRCGHLMPNILLQLQESRRRLYGVDDHPGGEETKNNTDVPPPSWTSSIGYCKENPSSQNNHHWWNPRRAGCDNVRSDGISSFCFISGGGGGELPRNYQMYQPSPSSWQFDD